MKFKSIALLLGFLFSTQSFAQQYNCPPNGRCLSATQMYNGTGTLYIPSVTPLSNRALITDNNNTPTNSITTATEISYVSGVTSPIQTQLNGKQPAGSYISSLTGDGTATGPGAATLTLATVATPGTFPKVTFNAKGLVTGGTALSGSDLPNPSPTTKGGVESIAAVAHNFVTQIGTDGSVLQAQPAFGDISGTIAGSQLPTFTGDVTNVNAAMTVAKIQGVTVSGVSGTGNVAFTTSPIFITPNLGTPSAVVLTNATGTATSLTAGNVITNANLTGPIISVGNATSVTALAITNGMLAGSIAASKLVLTDITTLSGLTSAASLALAASQITSGTLAIAQGGTNAATTSQNFAFIGPTSGSGAPSFRAIVAGDIPTLNQNTTGTAANITASSNTSLTSLANLATVGTLTGGSTGAGFTVALSTSTITGTLGATNGGTAQSTYALGDTLYSSATNTLSKLSGNTSATLAVLTQTGTGTVSASPVWTTTTGTGSVVLSTSPVFTTPNLGTPSALVCTNCSGTAASLTAGHVTTNANLTGPITSVGNATSIASQTGTGTTFVMNTSPTITSPQIASLTPDGTHTLTFPSVTDTLAVLGTAQSFTANQTFTAQMALGSISTSDTFVVNGTSPLSAASVNGINVAFTSQSGTTSSLRAYRAGLTTAASTTVSALTNYYSQVPTKGSGGTITNFTDFAAVGAVSHIGTNNAALADVTNYTGNYFLYQNGTDPSTFGGTVTVGGAITVNGTGQSKINGNVDFGTSASQASIGRFYNASNDARIEISSTSSYAKIESTYGATAGYKSLRIYTGGVNAAEFDNAQNLAVQGTQIAVGNTGTATGGHLAIISDDGTRRWLVGVLGSSGAKDFTIYDYANSATRFTINNSTGAIDLPGAVTADSTLAVTGQATFSNASAAGIVATGWSSGGGASAGGGQINIGNSGTGQGRVMYDNSGTSAFNIDNTLDNASAVINFRLRNAGSIITPLKVDGNNNTTTTGGVASNGYDTSTATSGTITASANKPGLSITGAGGTTLTIKLPSSPIDGQQYWVSSQGNFTTVTWQDSGGTAGNIIGGQAVLGGTSRGQRFVYISGQTKWFAI